VDDLAQEVQTLSATTDEFRGLLSDRLHSFQDIVSRTWQSQVETLDDYRRGIDTSLSELRRLLSDNDTALRQIGSKVDQLAAASESGDEDEDEAEAVSEQLLALDAKLDVLVERPAGGAAGGEELGSLAEDVRSSVREHDEAIAALASQIDARSSAMASQLTIAMEGLREDLVVQLRALGDEVVKLKRRVALRVGQSAATLSDEELDRIVDSVVTKLSAAFEIVQEEPEPPPPPASARRSGKGSRTSRR
jgi:chromosome segregation ATPase